jgi:hypothetical protein
MHDKLHTNLSGLKETTDNTYELQFGAWECELKLQYRVFQKELCNFESLYEFTHRTCTVF